LAGLLAKPELATAAAFAMATTPGREARLALERAMTDAPAGPARRLIVRAGIVRAIEIRDAPDGLGARLETLAASKDDADRALGVFGLVAVGKWSIERALGSCPRAGVPSGRAAQTSAACDEVAVHAAALAALARGPAAARQLMPLLEAAESELTSVG